MTEVPVCPACHGAGSYQGKTCPACNGTGKPALADLRDFQTIMRQLLPVIDGALRSVDEQELAEARAKVAEIEARIGLKPVPPVEASPVPPSDETDAGGGYGEAAIEGQTVEGFRDELRSLRAHARAKRLRAQ